MGSGQWAVGSWQLAVGSWQLAVGGGQLAVAYEVLVQTMDAVRNDGPEKLFDLVQLGAL